MTVARRLDRVWAATLFPPRCCLCRFPGASPELDLCHVCHADLPWLGATPEGCVIPLRYEHPVDDLVRRLKYHGAIANARVCGVLIAQAARTARAGPLPQLLVPVPLHGARLRERGFNQSAFIARYAGRLLDIPAAPRAVRRLRDTPSQTALDVSERHRNVRGAFAIADGRARARLSDAGHVAVVDDVVTTGSTAGELRRVLLAAGVRQVEVWAVARVVSATQATPAFFMTSGGGPSNFSSGTLPT